MNIYLSIIYRAIPLLMGAFTLGYGLFVWGRPDWPFSVLSAHILISLTAICIALFTTAATIIRQLLKSYYPFFKYGLPILGYTVSCICIASGIYIFETQTHIPEAIVSGHVVMGVGCIAMCVSTVCTASMRFTLIKENYKKAEGEVNSKAYSATWGHCLIAVPVLCVLYCWAFAAYQFMQPGMDHYIAARVMMGLSFICACLIVLVYTIVGQVRNTFQEQRKWWGARIVVALGAINMLWGLSILIDLPAPPAIAPGFVMIGLGLICWSISSKVILLVLVWRHTSEYAARIPLIPIGTAFTCFFISVFIYEIALQDSAYYIPAHILAGLGAICFTLYSIVSILESGTSGER